MSGSRSEGNAGNLIRLVYSERLIQKVMRLQLNDELGRKGQTKLWQ